MKKLTTEEFIKKATAKHGDRYLYGHVKYVNTRTKILVTCKEHGDFLITPNEHLQGGGCPVCNKSVKKTNKQFIEEAKKIHGDKYDYSKVEYVNTNSKVCIICPEHGEFWMTPKQHLQGHGCRKCALNKLSKKYMPSNADFVKKAKEIHGNKYDYSKVEYKNSKTKVCIICPEHGEFWQTPNMHLQGKGCPKCANEKNSKRLLLTIDEFIKRSKKVHGNKYDYSKVEYKNAREKVCIICPEHGEFWQMPYSHISGKGCPKCNESKLEEKIRISLEENEIAYVEYCNKKILPFLNNFTLDFYLPDYKTAIECQGEQHFMAVKHFGGDSAFLKTYEKDKIKKDLCDRNGIKLLYYSDLKIDYPYNVFINNEEIIKEIKNG